MVAEANAVQAKQRERGYWKKNGAEWTGMVEIRTRKKYMAVDEASLANDVIPFSGLDDPPQAMDYYSPLSFRGFCK